MKKKRKKIIITILITILALLLLTISIPFFVFEMTKKEEESKSLTFYLPRINSYASNWNYEMSNSDILKETESECYDYWHNDYEYWNFEPVKSGEVTIYFQAQQHAVVVEEECFSVTYYVDENYGITEISSENKPEKTNFDDDIGGLIKLKLTDRIIEFFIYLYALIVEVLFI